MIDVSRGARTRATFTGNNRAYPIWTRDGTRLTFADGAGETNRPLWTLADGSGGLQTLMDVGSRRYPTSWSPDGRTLALCVGGRIKVVKKCLAKEPARRWHTASDLHDELTWIAEARSDPTPSSRA